MAFKLTKSNISQIRLWLFLRERERRVMEGAGKNEAKRRRMTEMKRGQEGVRAEGQKESEIEER